MHFQHLLRDGFYMTLQATEQPAEQTNFSSKESDFIASSYTNAVDAEQDTTKQNSNVKIQTGHILIVEDDADIALIVQTYLQNANFEAVIASDGHEALEHLDKHQPCMVILDWMLPKLDGMDILQHIREYSNLSHLPVIMVTAKHEEESRVMGLELGADDYLTKPFSPRELLARVKAVLRRSQPLELSESFKRGPLEIQPEFRRVLFEGKEIEMTSLEFDLLFALAKDPGRVFKRDVLLDTVWGSDYIGIDRVVDVHVYNLRKKLAKVDEACANMIKTVWRIGYKFVDDAIEKSVEEA